MIDLKANPFFLDEEKENWVTKTLASLSEEEKIGHYGGLSAGISGRIQTRCNAVPSDACG